MTLRVLTQHALTGSLIATPTLLATGYSLHHGGLVALGGLSALAITLF